MPSNIAIPKEYKMVVIEKKPLFNRVFFIRTTMQETVPFKEGQYASFYIGNTRRLFSFANTTDEKRLEFIIGYTDTGVTRTLMDPLAVNDTITFLAPYGRFYLGEEIGSRVFIATGTGIAPVRSMIKKLLAQNAADPIHLFFGNYDQARLYLHDEFLQWEKDHPNFTYTPILSEADPAWKGAKGLVTTVVPQTISDLSDHTFYICGNKFMTHDMREVLLAAGVPKEKIKSEDFI